MFKEYGCELAHNEIRDRLFFFKADITLICVHLVERV